MTVVYFMLLLTAAVLLLVDAFSEADRRSRFTVRFLPLGLFCWVLVPLIQTAKHL